MGLITDPSGAGIWQQYGWYIAAAALALVQTLMIVTLVVQRARRHAAQARNEAILRAVPDTMFLQTRDGVYLDYHAPAGTAFPVGVEPLVGRHMRDVLPAGVSATLEGLFAHVQPGQAPAIIEYALPSPDGEHQYEARIVCCDDDQVLSLVRDITQQKAAAVTLQESLAELTRVSRLTALGEFAAAIAHEVRQPLTAIMMNAKTCLRWLGNGSPDLGEVRAAIRDVVDASQRADEIIRRNSELFRHHNVHKTPLDVNGVIREVAALTSARLVTSRCALILSLDPGLPVVNGDRVELQQVLLNLIGNGIEAMDGCDRHERRIEIVSGASAEGVQISVSDRGIGLAGVDLHRMFAPTYTTKADGTGVGLSISRSIIEAHGGKLWAEPGVERGASLVFTLPAASAASAT